MTLCLSVEAEGGELSRAASEGAFPRFLPCHLLQVLKA